LGSQGNNTFSEQGLIIRNIWLAALSRSGLTQHFAGSPL
jgi:hypothetical protein